MNSVCVYCGSSPGRRGVYAEAARALGRSLAARRIRLVYGGSSVGLMGVVADTVLGLGGEVVGVIPQALFDKEVGHPGLTELHVTTSCQVTPRFPQLTDTQFPAESPGVSGSWGAGL